MGLWESHEFGAEKPGSPHLTQMTQKTKTNLNM